MESSFQSKDALLNKEQLEHDTLRFNFVEQENENLKKGTCMMFLKTRDLK